MRRLLVLLWLIFVLFPSTARAQQNDFTAGQFVLVTAESATIRDAPSDTATSVATVAAGEELQILSDDPTESAGSFWWRVRSLDRNLGGWLPDTALAPMHLTATPVPVGSPTDCHGLQEYQTDYSIGNDSAADANPEALALLESAANSGAALDTFTASLTPEDMLLLRDYYLDLAAMMDGLDPPDFALEWHQLQLESYQLTADIYGDASKVGMASAGATHGDRAGQLIEALNTYFDRANPCIEFMQWSREQTIFASLLT